MNSEEFKILLVDAPENLSLWFNGTIPSPALSILASCLKKNYNLRVLDLSIEERPWEKLKRVLEEFRPHLAGVSCTHTCQINEVSAELKIIRKFSPDTIIAGGGIIFSVFYEKYIKEGLIDIAVRGEGEITVKQLAEILASSVGRDASPRRSLAENTCITGRMTEALGAVNGISFMNGNAVLSTPDRALIQSLDESPYPAYELYPMERYTSPTFGGSRAFGVIFSRGCSNRCKFCSEAYEWNYTMRKPSAGYAAGLIELLYNKYGRDIFVIGDTDFLYNRQWALEFAELIFEKKMKIKFHIQSCCGSVIKNQDILPVLKRAGLFEIMIGAESPFSDVLKNLKKPYSDPEIIDRAMKIIKANGLLLMTMLVWGTQYDNQKTLHEGLKYFGRYSDFVCPSPLTPYPGTPLFDEMKEKGKIFVTDYSLYDQAHVIMPAGDMDYETTRRVYEFELFKFFNMNIDFYLKMFSRNRFLRLNQRAYVKLVWIHAFESFASRFGYRKKLFKHDEYGKVINQRS
ncbi:MAG: Radical SAM superfamily protein [bacterium ADurb.Bin243]|nr:MAG: Radical SAM superfamily protein [bacterium ADurb.Bin243]HOD40171.1 radical SAM protein [Candidatus Wallbacteria bacterium]